MQMHVQNWARVILRGSFYIIKRKYPTKMECQWQKRLVLRNTSNVQFWLIKISRSCLKLPLKLFYQEVPLTLRNILVYYFEINWCHLFGFQIKVEIPLLLVYDKIWSANTLCLMGNFYSENRAIKKLFSNIFEYFWNHFQWTLCNLRWTSGKLQILY